MRSRLGALDLGVAHREAALDLDANVLAVEVGVLREELAMDVGDLAVEDREDPLVGRGELDRPAAREASDRRLDALANEGVGELGPGDADLELLERLELHGLEAGHERASIRSQPSTSSASGPPVSKLAASGQQPSSETRPCVGLCPTTPQHAAGIRIEPAESVPSAASASPAAKRRRGAPARPAGDAAREARVRDVAEMRVLGGRPVRELVQVRLADVHVARILEPQHRGSGPLGHVAGEDPRAVGRLQPAGVEEILDRQPDARSGRLRLGEEDRQSKAR